MPQAKYDLFWNNGECFDYQNYATWWDNDAYLTHRGVQIKALKGMLDRVTSPREWESTDYTAGNILKYNDFEFLLFDSWRFLLAFPEWATHATYLFYFDLLPTFFDSLFGGGK